MIVFLVLIDMFIPLSTDMYLPCLPLMSDYFHASTFSMNLTLSLFFLFYAIGILLWGPPSDRYGRKPILFSGVVLYVIGSLICCVTGGITVMIAARIVQGLGAGAITSIAMESGFKSISTFNRVFQTYKGCSPSEFKKHYLQQD